MSAATLLDTVYQHLPDSIKELLTIVNADVVLILVRGWGGTRVQLPKKAHSNHELAPYIGLDNLAKLCAYYGDSTLDIALCLKATRAVRDCHILADSRAGLSLKQLARKYKLAERSISKALRRIERQEYEAWTKTAMHYTQDDLFG